MATVDFSNLPKFLEAVRAAANQGLTDAAGMASRLIKRSMRTGARHTSSRPGSPPNVQRGFLRNGITWKKSTNLRAAVGVIPSVAYAMIHEKGGVIRPKRTKYLPIPVGPEGRRHAEKRGAASLRSDPSLRVIRARRGGLQIVQAFNKTKGSDSSRRIRTLYVLRRMVRLPARPYLRPGVFNNGPAITRAFVGGAQRSLRGWVNARVTAALPPASGGAV